MEGNKTTVKVALIEPAIEKLSEQAGNKYILCNVISKRAKEIMKANKDPNIEEKINNGVKEITEAANEFKSGELKVEGLDEKEEEQKEEK